MRHFLQDLRFAWRSFARTKGPVALAVVTLAIGIGGTTAIFSVIDNVLLDPLPFGRPERLVLLWRQNAAIGVGVQLSPSRPDAERWRTASTLEGLTVFGAQSFTLSGGAEPEQVTARTVEPALFSFLGVAPALGRPFTADDVKSSAAARVVILGDALWKRRYGADTGIVGRTISLSDQPYLVVGIMPAHFRLPLGKADVWIPYVSSAGAPAFGANVLARLKPGVTAAAAETELTTMMQAPAGVPGRWRVRAMWPGELAGTTFRRALMVLLGAVAFVLLIGCANIAGLLLARHASRAREMAIRAALGATRPRLVQQLLTESLLLSTMGGAAGLLVGISLLDVLAVIRPAQMEQLADVRLSGAMFAVAAVLTVATGLLFGVAPALAGTRERLEQALRQSARMMAHRRGTLARRVLTVAEVALACVLLTGAALLIRSYGRLLAASPGFQPERRISLRVSLPAARYGDTAARGEFFSRLLAQTRALPGVESASLAAGVPPNGGLIFGTLQIEGQAPPADAAPAPFSGGPVTPGFFRTLGIPIVDGRDFVEHDPFAAPVIVNQSAARRWWPGRSALGQRLRFGAKSPWQTVVGVAGDIGSTATFGDVQIYQPLTPANADSDATLVVAATGDPASLAGALKGQVWSIDPRLPVTDLQTLDAAMAETLSRPRFNVLLLTAFAVAGLLLAAIGIYGVISYSVGQRTAEIGLRIALGAVPGDIHRAVIGEAATLAAAGLAIGAGAALLMMRLMSALLFEVSAADPVSFAGAAAVLASTALAAAWVPARRAMRVDPAIALRAD